MRWLLFIIGVSLLPSVGRADDQNSRTLHVFLTVCSALIDEGPGIEALAASLGLRYNQKNASRVAVGNMAFSTYAFDGGPDINVSRTNYSDATEIECTTRGKIMFNAAESDEFNAWLVTKRFDGEGTRQPLAILNGRWKRAGSNPLIFFAIAGVAGHTFLAMKRIELLDTPPDSRRDANTPIQPPP
jgi:hypothetical protein